MKRPAFQFYPADWRKDAALQSCSLAARGAWIDLLCIMHECDPYGALVINDKPMGTAQIARLLGESVDDMQRILDELEACGVFARREDGAICSRRMQRDEHLRNVRAESGRLGGNPNLLKQKDKQNPSKQESGANQSDKQNPTPSSSSSASASDQEKEASPLGAGAPPFGVHQPIVDAYHELLPNCQTISTPAPQRLKRLANAAKLAKRVCASNGWTYEPATFWHGYFAVCANDPWLRGDVSNPNNARWKQNLDVLLADERLAQVIDQAINSMKEST